MPRVNRTLVLTLLLVSSCAFLLFQLRYYRQYGSTRGVLNPASHVTTSHLQWKTLKKFLALAQRFQLPLFLADTAVLSLLTHDALQQPLREPRCIFLCTGRPVTSFALHANQWKYDPSFLLAVEEKGFQLLELRGEDPRLASLDTLSGEEIPLHFLFRLHGYVIQEKAGFFSEALIGRSAWAKPPHASFRSEPPSVVFLYERSGNYLWHGALRLKASADRSFAPYTRLDYGRHAGAYERPQLILTTLDGLDVQVPRNVSRFLAQQKHARFLECRYRDARNFLQLYPEDSSSPAVEFRRKAKSLLHLAARTLAHLDVPFWLSSGTCLGWFRQCNIISYSRDVDIGVFVADFRADIIVALTDAGLRLKHKFGKVEDSLELSFLGEDVKLDIFFFYEENDLVWNGGTQAKSGRKFKYIFPRFSLCWAELLELKVRVPCETLDYVTANYGTSWSVPVRTWDWKSSPSNVLENGVWPLAEWAELIQVY